MRFDIDNDKETGKLHIVYHVDIANVQQSLSEKASVGTRDVSSNRHTPARRSLFRSIRRTVAPLPSHLSEAGTHVDAMSCLPGHDLQLNMSSKMQADSFSSSSPHSDSIASIRDLGSSRSTPFTLCPAFEHQSIVEYLSESASCWVHAKLEVKESGNSDLVYSVILLTAKKQRRDKVPLACLRSPMRVGETVDAYITEQETWHKAVIHKSPAPQRGRNIVYVVRLTDGDRNQVFFRVPSHNVVRVFPEGCCVEVYRDASRGWELATVLTALPEELLATEMEVADNSSEDMDTVETVPVCLANSSNHGADLCMRVPYYLVRLCKSCPAICHVFI